MSLGGLDGELEDDVLVGDVLVDFAEGVQLGLNVHKILRVKEDLQGLGAINLVSDSLADDLGGVDDVLRMNSESKLELKLIKLKQHMYLKDSLVDGGEGSRAGAGTGLAGGTVGGLGEDGALTDDHDVSAAVIMKHRNKKRSPINGMFSIRK